MRLLVVSLAALLVPASCEQLSCLCPGLQAGGGVLQLSCLKSEGQNVTCTDDGTNFGNVEGTVAANDIVSPPASHIAKRSVTCQPDESLALSGYTYVSAVGLVKLTRVHTRYADAKQRCQRDGGRLVNHYDRNATRALASLFPKNSELASAYTGVHYNRAKGRFYGSDGKSVSNLPWAKGQPSNRLGEDCVVVSSGGWLSRAPCDRLAPFICERPSRAPKGYTWAPNAGRFLMIGKERKKQSDAQKACRKDGAELAVPDTWKRAETMLRYASSRVDEFYVGFTHKFIGSDYVTPGGKLMSSMEFRNWESEDHLKKIRLKFDGCVTLHSEGYYDDVNCSKKHYYLCELKP